MPAPERPTCTGYLGGHPLPFTSRRLRGGPEKTTAPRLVAGGLSVADCVWGVSRRCIGRRVAEAGEAVRCKRTQNGCDRRGYPGKAQWCNHVCVISAHGSFCGVVPAR